MQGEAAIQEKIKLNTDNLQSNARSLFTLPSTGIRILLPVFCSAIFSSVLRSSQGKPKIDRTRTLSVLLLRVTNEPRRSGGFRIRETCKVARLTQETQNSKHIRNLEHCKERKHIINKHELKKKKKRSRRKWNKKERNKIMHWTKSTLFCFIYFFHILFFLNFLNKSIIIAYSK